MDAFFVALACLLVGVAAGYALGWNRAKHPGKVEAEFDAAAAAVKAKLGK